MRYFDGGVAVIVPDDDAAGPDELARELAIVKNRALAVIAIDEDGVARLEIVRFELERILHEQKEPIIGGGVLSRLDWNFVLLTLQRRLMDERNIDADVALERSDVLEQCLGGVAAITAEFDKDFRRDAVSKRDDDSRLFRIQMPIGRLNRAGEFGFGDRTDFHANAS